MKKKIIYITMLLIYSMTSFAQYPDRPNPMQAVNDYAGVLSKTELQALNTKLENFKRETSKEIVVVLVKDLKGMDREDYTISLAQDWGIGEKGRDNGIMIMVYPKSKKSLRDGYIAVGLGMENLVPEAITSQIMNDEMIPNVKKGKYYKGINGAVDVMMGLTRGEFTVQEYNGEVQSRKSAVKWKVAILLIIMLTLVLLNLFRGAYHYGRTNNMEFWSALILMINAGSRKGKYGNFERGTGGFGGNYGNGANYGGGGAGGSW